MIVGVWPPNDMVAGDQAEQSRFLKVQELVGRVESPCNCGNIWKSVAELETEWSCNTQTAKSHAFREKSSKTLLANKAAGSDATGAATPALFYLGLFFF